MSIAAILVVFIMITTSFVTILATADDYDPQVWTDRDEYCQGETVYIYGEGFARWVDVQIELSHSDFETKLFTETPDYYGRFMCDDYVAEMVTHNESVKVTVTQTLADEVLVAETEFWDPAAYMEGYTLAPHKKFTKGDIKGWFEGDSIPFLVGLDRAQLGGGPEVTVWLSFDYCDHNSPTTPVYGIDFLTEYWDPLVNPPFNTLPQSASPFKPDDGDGALSDVQELPHGWAEGGIQELMLWKFTFTFADGVDYATIRFGAHLARTSDAGGYDPVGLGAGFYPGAALHVNLYELDPSANEGALDVPISTVGILIPPEMTLDKSCTPCQVAMGDEITFTIEWSNIGGATASCVVLSDDLPHVVDLDESSFLHWTSTNPSKLLVDDVDVVDRHFEWGIASWAGTGLDGVNPPLVGYLEFKATVNTNDQGCYTNYAMLTYTDNHGGYYPPVEAECTFCIVGEPEIDVEKSGPVYAHVGDDVTYTYTITNTGPVDLVDVDAYDDVAGTVVEDDTLAVGESKTYTLPYEILETDPDHLVNCVEATGEDGYGRSATDSACWEIDILYPEIIVEKIVDPGCAEIGEEVTYTITVTNPTCDTDLFDVVVDDPIIGTWNVDFLLAGQSHVITESLVIDESHDDPLVNVVTARGYDALGLEVCDDDSATVEIYHPMVEITKEANLECAEPGEVITYWINVTNPSWDTDLVRAIVYDTMFGTIYDDSIPRDTTVPLGPFYYTVPRDVEMVCNWVTVDAWDIQGHYVDDCAVWEVEIFHPAIAIHKWSEWVCAEEGETVEYFIDVWNPSYDTTMWAEVYDPMLGGYLWSGYLAPDESHLIGPLPYIVPEDTEWVLNTAYVNAWDHQLHDEYAEDSWEIEIFHPDIEISKWSEWTCAEEGETVEFFIDVRNPSYDATMWAEVYDPMLGGLLWSGYLASFEAMPLGPYPYTIPDDSELIINTAYVEAWDHQKHYVYDESTWEIEIFHPAIAIDKWADLECAEEGETITYWIEVSNPSHDATMTATVSDPLLSDVPLWSGDLAPGASHLIGPLPYVVPMQTEWVENTAYVRAVDHQDHDEYAEDSWLVEIFHPDIAIDKWANLECAEEGETIVYYIDVYNPSYDATMDAVVWDPMLSADPLWSGQLLPLTGTTLGPYYYVVPDDTEWVNNTAYVDAWDHQRHYRSAEDSWTVEIFHPDIEINKWSEWTCAEEGEVVLYYIDVWNPSHDATMDAVVYDLMLSADALWSGRLAPGERVNLGPFEYQVPRDTEWVNNTAVVEALDHQEHYVCDESTWAIEIFHPAIMIDKWSEWICAEEGETVEYWIEVMNPSWDATMYAQVFDTLLSVDPLWMGYLGPGESILLGPYDYVVPEDTEWVLNTAYVDAWDHQDHYQYDFSSWEIEIFHPAIAIEKWSELTCAHDGETISYFITVWNPSYDATMYAVVVDEMFGMDPLFEGYIAPRDIIDLGPYYFTVPVGAEWVNNTVYVDAWDHQDHHRYAEATWSVEILHPDIEVTKTGPDAASVGETITYYVDVTNTGDTELFEVDVHDSLVGYIAMGLTLDIGETVYLSYDYIVPAGEGTLDNLVTVIGRDRQDVWVCDEDEWVVYKDGEINGFKTADLNLNAQMDEGEPGLMNWVIELSGELFAGGWDNRTRLTDSSGYYEFTGLMAGVYTVSEVMQSGWTHITVESYTVTVGSGTILARNFGNIPYGSICGYKWLDANMNGIWDEGEDPIAGWTIYIYGEDVSGAIVNDVAVTDESGLYCFGGLLPGVYTVSEEIRDGWVATTPISVVVDVSALEPFEITGVNFGNVKYGQITGYKWLDEWMNGIWDGHEVPIAGWTIELTGVLADGSLFGPVYTTTDMNGFYCFAGLLPGTYIVREIIPEGWANITPDRYEVTIDMGDTVFCAKFGNVEYGKIDGWKFLDWDMDGFFDGVEDGLAGWAITLEGWLNDGIPPWSLEGTYVGPFTVYTDADGYWYFDDLLPGMYRVVEEDRDLWYATTEMEKWIMVGSGSYVFDQKFGNVPYTCLWGYKFEDVNGDGRWGEVEPGLPGWTIVVEGMQNDDVPVYIEMVTDEYGYWATCYNILPGDYIIYEIPQAGWIPTTPDIYQFEIPMCMEPMDYMFLFGNFELGRICGYKYEDMNGNGVLDDGDMPIAGWEMYLSGAATNMTTTDADGFFCFENLMYGEYTVTEEERSGWVAMTPISHTAMVLSGSDICLPVFLNVEYSKVWGYKFEDVNSNGVWDEGEPGIEGWTIYMVWDADPTEYVTTTDENGYYEFLYLMPDEEYLIWEEDRAGWTPTTQKWEMFGLVSGSDHRVHDFGNFENVDIWVFKYEDVNSNGMYDEGDHPLEDWGIMVSGPGVPGGTVTLLTGADGWASVEVTAAGMYEVMEMVPSGWTPTTPTMEMVSVESGYCEPEYVMFGNFRDVTIELFKYEDMNSNGVFDNDDVPISGWEFYFENEAGTESFTVVTGPDGTVTVTFHSSDLWTITEEMPPGWVPVNPASGMAHVLIMSGLAYSLDMQMECYYYEFGNFHCADILVFKYWDKCSNGWYDPDFGDEPIARWYFELRDATGALLDSGYTNENGELHFTVCHAGVYYVIEEDRDGWSQIDPASGYFEVEIESGEGLIELWFANYLDVDIPIFKYEDRNSNGEYDEGDVPIEGWYFEMTREGDDTTFSGYTDENGELVLTVNRSGIYVLVEEDRDGWTAINPAGGARLLSITSGTEVPVQMFGNFRDVTIWVFKYEDMNSNGEYDEGDMPLEGWSFTVTGPWAGSGAVITTGSDGYASVVVDRAGTYTVTEEDRDGWTHTTPPVVDMSVWSSMQECPVMFGNFKDVEITVFKFEDVNSNGVYDDGDRPLEGWLMILYAMDHDEFHLAYTDATGHATFVLTYSDFFYLEEELQGGWVQTCPEMGWYEFPVYSGSLYPVFEFGNFNCVWIEVFKYDDVNSNGEYDEGDRPVEGWHFYLYDPTGMPCGEAVTDETGHAGFLVCRAGEWIVEEEMREHVTPINPACGWLPVEVWSSAQPETLMFGNFWDVLIIVFKYEDVNSNGVYDNDDVPIPRWMFEISGPGVTNAVEYTDEYGYAYFWVNRAGTYTVTEEDREGWTHVNPADGDLDVTVTSGCMPEPLMFGNFEDVIIIIFKFDDRYADGQYCPDEGDVPIEGWVFELYVLVGDDWVLVATGMTDSDGYLEFVLTQAGVYKVVEILQPGWFIILPVSGEYVVEVESGDEPIWLTFANFKLGKIFGWKWNDLNGNGVWDEGEPGIEGWTIHFECWFYVGDYMYYLYGTDTTDESGYYEFTGLPPGVYLVWEELVSGWVPTSPPVAEVEVIGHTEARVDFLNFEEGCVWGYKFEDMNGNGVLDDGDTPLPGWMVYLYLGDSLVASTETDGDGYYMFCGLGPGVYTVVEEARRGWIATNEPSEMFAMTSGASVRIHEFLNFELGIIIGWKFEDVNSNGVWDEGEPAIEGWPIHMIMDSTPDELLEYTDGNGMFVFDGLMADSYYVWEQDIAGWTHTTQPWALVDILSGSVIELCPFGNFKDVPIELFKYEDVDGNGVYNEGDRPIEGWMFTVEGPCFPTPLVAYTDENGEIMAWITMAGMYTVTEEDRDGWIHVNPESGSVSFDVESGDVFKPFMFGNFMLGEITGKKFYDWNMNGIQDEGEVGLANWVIWINGTLVGGGYMNFTRLTDSSGFYQVSGLPAGIYVVSERLEYSPMGWVPTLPTSVAVDITSGKATAVSFANAVFGIIEGYKFYDKDLDGVWDEEEPGLAGWTIVLDGVTDEGVIVYRTTTTDASGYYLFDLVQPGTYEVTEVLPLNWAPTTPLPVVVDMSGAMEYFEASVYIGNIRYAKVFGYKFLDTIPDCYPYWPNGIFDEYEHGLSDWEITLEGWTSTGEYVSMVRYTDENGYYEFTDLLPGTYWINETLLWGWYASRPISNMVMIFPYPQGMVVFRIDFGNVLPEPDPEVPFFLEQGWNLWSMPIVVDGLTASGLLAAMGQNGYIVTMLDEAEKRYYSYVVGDDTKTDFPIESGDGYFVYVLADTSFTLTGYFPSVSSTELQSGWNFIGYSALEPTMASELLSRVDGLVLTCYDEENGRYVSYVAGDDAEYDFLVTPNNAYYLWVSGSCQLVFG